MLKKWDTFYRGSIDIHESKFEFANEMKKKSLKLRFRVMKIGTKKHGDGYKKIIAH